MITRRSFFSGLAATLAAPAIVHAGNLMPISSRNLFGPRGAYSYLAYNDIVRQAFVPRLFVQLYVASPVAFEIAALEQTR